MEAWDATSDHPLLPVEVVMVTVLVLEVLESAASLARLLRSWSLCQR